MLNNKKGIIFLIILFIFIFGYVFFEDDFLEYQNFKEEKTFVEEYNSGEWQKKNKTEKKYGDKLIPYTEKLPNLPKTKDVKKYFIDENKNGVRDDVEIKIVKRFWEHKDMVESFFAESRVKEYEIYLAQNSLLRREKLRESLSFFSMSIDCSYYFYKKGVQYIDGDYILISSKVFKNYYNSKEREHKFYAFEKAVGGYLIGGNFESEEVCQNFFKKSKNLIPR